DNFNWTPLLLATSDGYKAVVKLLLIRDNINPNSKDKFGAIPLLLAAEYRSEAGIVKLLLTRKGVNSNSKDSNNWTPLL
ncbi:uncharacterized protein K441DRAFT_573005, partial [Cenococcum geophilum 1.58]|uniref:uncharacterized protein n=1 Tax=Cenococcum geophilum 1.58 TaxID=794803 RepID=UPI00358FE275